MNPYKLTAMLISLIFFAIKSMFSSYYIPQMPIYTKSPEAMWKKPKINDNNGKRSRRKKRIKIQFHKMN